MPPSYIRVRAVVWAYGRGQTDTQTLVTTIHFASSTTHAKCNNNNYNHDKTMSATQLSIVDAHQTLRRCNQTRPSVVLTVRCSTDAVATRSSVDVHR